MKKHTQQSIGNDPRMCHSSQWMLLLLLRAVVILASSHGHEFGMVAEISMPVEGGYGYGSSVEIV